MECGRISNSTYVGDVQTSRMSRELVGRLKDHKDVVRAGHDDHLVLFFLLPLLSF